MSRKRVLIVDDDDEIRDTIGAVLQSEGYEVAGARNGRHAQELLASQPPPAVILLDLMMPVMNGLEFLDWKRSTSAFDQTPVIVMSAYTKVREMPGVVQVMQKPFDLDHLVKALASAAQS